MTAIDDRWPEENFYFRSDHYNFAKNGVPVLFFFNGVHDDYHQPSDCPDKINGDKESRILQLLFYLGQAVGEQPAAPAVEPGRLQEDRHPAQARLVSGETRAAWAALLVSAAAPLAAQSETSPESCRHHHPDHGVTRRINIIADFDDGARHAESRARVDRGVHARSSRRSGSGPGATAAATCSATRWCSASCRRSARSWNSPTRAARAASCCRTRPRSASGSVKRRGRRSSAGRCWSASHRIGQAAGGQPPPGAVSRLGGGVGLGAAVCQFPGGQGDDRRSARHRGHQ